MSIFGNKSATSITAPVYEGYGVEVNGDLIALQESYQDQLDTVRAIHAMDMEELKVNADVRQLQESGASEDAIINRIDQFEIATESMVKNAWESIKTFFRKLWGKLRAFFDTVVRFFDGVFRSGESFVKKYEPQLKKLDLAGYEYKMYTYTHLDEPIGDVKDVKKKYEEMLNDVIDLAASAGNAHAAGTVQNHIEKMKETKDEDLEEARGKLVGAGSLTAEQYKEKLFAYYRKGATGEDDKKDEKINITVIIETLKDTKAKTNAEKFIKAVDDEFAAMLRKIGEIENKISSAKSSGSDDERTYSTTLGKGDNARHVTYSKGNQQLALEAIRVLSGFFSNVKEIEMQAFRAWREAWAERNAVYKQVAVSAFRYKKEK